jgi:curli biogenesis system outer membrane secretion channel CsgG
LPGNVEEPHMNNFTRNKKEIMSRLITYRVTGAALAWLLAAGLAGCAKESHQALATPKPASAGTVYTGVKSTLVVGKFDNRSSYMRGLFSDGVDQLGGQAKTILIGSLQETGRFKVMDRDNMEEIAREAKLKGQAQTIQAADFAITGDVVEFGRKEVGDVELFGILGSGKKQIAYSKVTLNVVDVLTSEVVYSVSGAGEYALSNREIIGFGSTAAYDSTLNGKVLDLAIREAINRLVEGVEQGKWKPAK